MPLDNKTGEKILRNNIRVAEYCKKAVSESMTDNKNRLEKLWKKLFKNTLKSSENTFVYDVMKTMWMGDTSKPQDITELLRREKITYYLIEHAEKMDVYHKNSDKDKRVTRVLNELSEKVHLSELQKDMLRLATADCLSNHYLNEFLYYIDSRVLENYAKIYNHAVINQNPSEIGYVYKDPVGIYLGDSAVPDCEESDSENIIIPLFTFRQRRADFTRDYIIVKHGLKNLKEYYEKVRELVDTGLVVECPYSNIELDQNCLKALYYSYHNNEKLNFCIEGKVTSKSHLTSKKDFGHLEEDVKTVKNIIKKSLENKTKGTNILLWGYHGTGKSTLARLICEEMGLDAYEVGVVEKDYRRNDRPKENVSEIENSAILRVLEAVAKNKALKNENAVIIIDEASDIFFSEACKLHINKILEETNVPVIWTINWINFVDTAYLRRMTYSVFFDKCTSKVRESLWTKELKKKKLKVPKKEIKLFAKKYECAVNVIENAISNVVNGGEDWESLHKYLESSSEVIGFKVNKGIDEISGDYLKELVNADIDVNHLTSQLKSVGKLDFSLCLYGRSGTGKSQYAKYLAEQLGIEYTLVKASDLISPYVGETEINIARAFSSAEEEKKMLIIDEADTFLRDRSLADKSYETTMVNEMLTQMEHFTQPFVCTTNLMEVIDQAALRRFTFKISFKFLTLDQSLLAFKHFFKKRITTEELNLKNLSAGDFANVRKKAEFLGTKKPVELVKLLRDEVKVKPKDTLDVSNMGF